MNMSSDTRRPRADRQPKATRAAPRGYHPVILGERIKLGCQQHHATDDKYLDK